MDGHSLLELFEHPDTSLNRPLVWHFPYYHPEGIAFARAKPDIGINDFQVSQTRPQSAIRVGNYKLISFAEDRAPSCTIFIMTARSSRI